MTKTILENPVLLCFYGYPGSGKSYVARNLANDVQMAHVSADRIRNELFQQPRYDAQENAIVLHLMNYMTEEFLDSGVSVVYDTNAMRLAQRRNLREMARRHRAHYFLVWLQVDIDSAFARTQKRDRRTTDDKYAQPQSRATFEKEVAGMQNPNDEEYMVISGKHNFSTQKSAIINRLFQIGLINSDSVQQHVTKPELVNLVPNPYGGRVDMSRRNITVRE